MLLHTTSLPWKMPRRLITTYVMLGRGGSSVAPPPLPPQASAQQKSKEEEEDPLNLYEFLDELDAAHAGEMSPAEFQAANGV
jgi:hypothetical protein